MGWRRRWTAAAAVLLASAAPPATAGVVEANLKVVSTSDLGKPGAYGDVTVVGTTAVVATETLPAPASPCPSAGVTVVGIKDPNKPQVIASIGLPAGTTVADLDSLTVITPAFTGDLLAVASVPLEGGCAGGEAGSTGYYDITDPAASRVLARTSGASSVSLAQRVDGRVLAVRASGAGVEVDDLSDPAQPAALGRWAPAAAGGPCARVDAYDDGLGMVAAFGGRVHDVDLTEPTRPIAAEPAGGAGGHVGVMPLGNRTIAIVAEDPVCEGDAAADAGLRVLTLERGGVPLEEAPVRYPGGGGPARLVTSGSLAYVAWHGAGVRVVDFGEVHARTVAQFIPTRGNVVAVALLPEHVVVTDASLGLYVLERPDEGGGRATFWSQFVSLLPYVGFAGVLAALFLVPRLVAGRAGVPGGVPLPGAEPVRRRRA